MHRDLHLGNLAQLPFSVRKVASAACSANRSSRAVERFLEVVADCSESEARSFLPVFYILLDPAGIPSMAQLDTAAGQTEGTIQQVLDLLQALNNIYIPLHLGPDLWSRIWPWARWIHTYKDHLSGPPLREGRFCVDLLVLAGHFHESSDVAVAYIWDAPGFKYLVARTWIFVLETRDAARRIQAMMCLCGFLGVSDPSKPTNFKEMVDGAGGTVHHLGRLVVKFMDTVLAQRSTPLSITDLYFIRIILDFIAEAARMAVPGEGNWFETGPMAAVLPSHDIARVLATTAYALAEHTADDVAYTLDQCFVILGRIFLVNSGHRFLPSALRSGLLRAVVSSAHFKEITIQNHLNLFLTVVLPGCLIYHGVLSDLAAALRGVAKISSKTAFQKSNIAEKWNRFTNSADQRLELFKLFESKQYILDRACDNLQCGTVDVETKFRRCSGCLTFYYCSSACQTSDWQGGHRHACASYGSLCLSERHGLTVRERRFIRTVVHEDYSTSKSDIYAKQSIELHRDSNGAFFTLFDYIGGAVRIAVYSKDSASSVADALRAYGEEWTDSVARAERSSGKMALDVVRILNGRAPRYVVPLRKTRSDIEGALNEVAAGLRRSKEETLAMDFSEKFKDVDKDVVETH
ncbi:hypothetical protein C8R44DRAFT_985119 [Mycena epipterygia]|nr:hypothetical protein C8R44DRAFT_985119 [Mycena epipterygia]